MKLVIAEKPSVAQALAKVIRATKREDGYLEGKGSAGCLWFWNSTSNLQVAARCSLTNDG